MAGCHAAAADPQLATTRTLLQARVRAWSSGSRSGWLADLSGSTLTAEQARVFDRMRAVQVGSLKLRSLCPVPTTSTPTSTSTPAPTVVVARFGYRLTGFDTADRTFEVTVNVEPSNLRTAGGRITGWSPYGRPELWDLPGLTVRRDPSALVISAGAPGRADDLLTRARRASAQVASVWGGGTRPAVWVAPATTDDAARLLGRDPADLGVRSEVSAVTDGPLRPGRLAGADRVVVLPQAWASLTGVGRDVVLTHELTHVVVRASTTGAVPRWLSEGFAELVAYHEVTVPDRVLLASAVDSARRNGPLGGLPTDTDFAPGTAGYRAAYAWSLLTVRAIARRHGLPGLVRFYRAVAGGSSTESALAEVLHTDRTTLLREVRAAADRLVS